MAILVLQTLTASTPGPLGFFRPDVDLDESQSRALAAGEPVLTMLPTHGREFAVLSAIAIGGQVTADGVYAWLRQIEHLRRNRYVLATGRFSMPPRIEDLEGLTLDDEDLEDIRRCRPGHCGVKLTADEIAEFQRTIAAAGSHWQPAVEATFRALMVRRARAYAVGGHNALATYVDHRRPRGVAEAFTSLLNHAPFLRERVPDVVDTALRCPATSIADGEGFMYWAKEKLGGKAVISATHVTLVRGEGNGTGALEAMAVSIQVFATHYLDASLAVTAVVRDQRSSQRFFVYTNRSDVDILGGWWGGIARSVIESRVRKDGPEILRAVNRRISEPARSAVEPVQPRR
jgi:hypothetical protein